MAPLSHEELKELDQFLLYGVDNDEAMTPDTLDGFLYAIAVGPQTIMPSQWLPKVWGEDSAMMPTMDSMAQLNNIMGLVMPHYSSIKTSPAPAAVARSSINAVGQRLICTKPFSRFDFHETQTFCHHVHFVLDAIRRLDVMARRLCQSGQLWRQFWGHQLQLQVFHLNPLSVRGLSRQGALPA